MRSLADGIGFLLQGVRTFAATPSIWPLGLFPVVIVAVVMGAVLVLLAGNLDPVAATVTPFADDWAPALRSAARFIAGVAVLGGAIALAVLTFATLTNLVGQPFYEAISERVERGLGETPPSTPPWWRTLPRATAESLALLAIGLGAGAVLLLLNLVPVLGQAVGAVVWGYLLAVELLAIPLQRHGFFLRDRLRLMWRHRMLVSGFGIAAFLVFLIPLMNLLVMPGAIVGGTLLAHHIRASAATGLQRP